MKSFIIAICRKEKKNIYVGSVCVFEDTFLGGYILQRRHLKCDKSYTTIH